MPIIARATVDSAVAPEALWAVLSDVEGRPRWHPGLAWARLDGPLVPGATGYWKPHRARPVRVTVTEVEPRRRLVFEGVHGPPVARGHYEHEIEPLAGGGSRLTHRMRLSGPLARPLGRV